MAWQGSNPGSFTIAQVYNGLLGTDYAGVYITKPRHYSKSKQYPVVFFAHGYAGSWELYQGILSRLEDCIVVGISTRDVSGIFTGQDINRIFSQYIPLLKSKGYNVDEKSVHLMGLSNGGSATNVALRSYGHRFQTITFMSTPCNVIKYSPAKVLLIGGSKDGSDMGMPSAAKRLKGCGTRTALFYEKGENHYILAYRKKEIMDFLNREMGLK